MTTISATLPAAMNFWSPHELQRIITGRWLVEPGDEPGRLRGITTDTRATRPGQVFLALKGVRFDAHDFLREAIVGGARLLIVSDEEKALGQLEGVAGKQDGESAPAVVLVQDTLKALQQLAAAYREVLRQQGTKVIAVAGSNGKTTTRHLIHCVLSTCLRGTQSPKSFNNHIGVPLTLLAAQQGDDFVVVEAGTNHPGELAELGEIIRPDIVVVTNIGSEHMEHFKTLAGVAAEEASVLGFLPGNGLAVVAGDHRELEPYLERVPDGVRVIRFGRGEGCDLRLLGCQATGSGLNFTIASKDRPANREKFLLPLLGEHNALNALAVIAVARAMGMDESQIVGGLSGATGVDMRMQVSRIAAGPGSPDVVILNDAYNANPDSVRAAIRTLAEYPLISPQSARNFPAGSSETATTQAGIDERMPLPLLRRVAILGDMLELGEQGPDLHRAIVQSVVSLKDNQAIDRVILIGKLSMFTAEALLRSWPASRVHTIPQWSDSLPGDVARQIEPGDVVLIKASRGMGLERLVPAIEAKLGSPRESKKE